MPNKRNPYKRSLQLYIDEFTYEKFKKYAAKIGIPMVTILTAYIEHIAAEIVLSPEEEQQICDRIIKRMRKN